MSKEGEKKRVRAWYGDSGDSNSTIHSIRAQTFIRKWMTALVARKIQMCWHARVWKMQD